MPQTPQPVETETRSSPIPVKAGFALLGAMVLVDGVAGALRHR